MGRKEFDVSELDIIDYRKCGAMAIFKPLFGGNVPPEPVYNTPITPKENWKLAAAGKKPYWIPRGGWGFCDINVFRPRIHPDSVVTHIICDGEEDYPYTSNTMTSGWFGLDCGRSYGQAGKSQGSGCFLLGRVRVTSRS